MSPQPLLPASSLRTALVWVVAAASLVMGMAAIPTIVRLDPAPWLAASLATAAMCGLTVRLAARSLVEPGTAVGRTVGWALLLGVANGPVAFMAACVAERGSLDSLAFLPLVAVVGSPFGLGFGLLFGLALSIPVATFMRAWQRPSPDATDTTLAALGVWLALASAGTVLVLAMRLHPSIPHGPWGAGGDEPWHGTALLSTAWGMGLLGAGLAVVAGLRRASRHRFVARVALGLVPSWRLVAAPVDATERADLQRLPCLGETPLECDHVLVRCEEAGDGAYRRAATQWPVAWVPRTWLGARIIESAHEPPAPRAA
ncbi:hypothetical protein [Paraliomyxa miuraensis]|uniref:hypothetical protein n=1 Tax=Paraliomyxa miuraensis TaxID=376150 RepID=UPI00225C2449|nr:hypothetical protein [Paraliomyxa miuraensis]MCX4247736.1 hypothetical protein [Paraliomyxa miuraensis]